jgi:hypothetical protein
LNKTLSGMAYQSWLGEIFEVLSFHKALHYTTCYVSFKMLVR